MGAVRLLVAGICEPTAYRLAALPVTSCLLPLLHGGGQLEDAEQVLRARTILVTLEPLSEGGLEGVTTGRSCIANAYRINQNLIDLGKIDAVRGLALHAVDAVGIVHLRSCGCGRCCCRSRLPCSADIETMDSSSHVLGGSLVRAVLITDALCFGLKCALKGILAVAVVIASS